MIIKIRDKHASLLSQTAKSRKQKSKRDGTVTSQ